MANINNEDELIASFKSKWDSGELALKEFIKRCDPVASSDVQLKLLRCDLNRRLTSGQVPSPINYEKHFPHFAGLVDGVVVDEIVGISGEESPLESRFGALPVRIGGYEVLHRSGHDCSSVHYDAIQISLQRKVCLRILLFPMPETVSKASTVARMEHPNLESVVDVFRYHSSSFIVTQLEEGVPVSELLRENADSITAPKAVRWVRRIAEGLLEMHRHDVAHMNVSPYKIITRVNGEAVLVNPDFELPIEEVFDDSFPSLHELLPFPYRSIAHSTPYSIDRARDDTIALGLVLFQLLTKLPMDSFYLGSPGPDESMRMKKLIEDQLNYSSLIDPTLKELCLGSTLGVMDDVNPCSLEEFRSQLLSWEKRNNLKVVHDAEIDEGHTQNEILRKAAAKVFPWLSGQ